MSIKEDIELCSCNIIHSDIVSKVKEMLPESNICTGLAEFYKAFADQTRVRILKALLYSEMCVCDLTAALGMTQSAISHQLRILKDKKLVKFRKSGKIIYYSLDDKHIKDIFRAGFEHINEQV
ncbi:metalloregulator ArsR/SmtB family transcription factor [Lentisphaerota bacterium ZTH]|nr:helix-turn-helix transcriptional regulator [Lentisphaerota bacterium]WET06285.1 metalloregulator ArsR/SmtB family transcription factor [Lentisphaerota bacterium ZTH]